ncbi:MAG: hypothetical protein AAF697_11170 [Pseudomonadota bacterium]
MSVLAASTGPGWANSEAAFPPIPVLVDVTDRHFELAANGESAGAGVALVTDIGSQRITVAFANARSQANKILAVQAGNWREVAEIQITADADSSSALCWAYLGHASKPSLVSANQHGEPNRFYAAGASDAVRSDWVGAGSGDIYDCRFGDYSGDGYLHRYVTSLDEPDQRSPYVQRTVVLLEGTNKTMGEPEFMQELQRAHLANIRAMAEAGLLYLAGPLVSEDNDQKVRGILVFGPPSQEMQRRVEALLASDPMIAAGYLRPRFTTLTFERGNSLSQPISSDR